MDSYAVLKTAHILSSTVLFGTGLGTAFQMWMAHRTGQAGSIATVGRNVVLADWCFTTPAGFIQPITSVALASLAGYPLSSSWLVATYLLYALAGLCWLPVVALQMRATQLARAAADAGGTLPPAYHRIMRAWFWLGWPAFMALVAVFFLMVSKPEIW